MPYRRLATLLLLTLIGIVSAESSAPQTGLTGFYYSTADFSGPVHARIDSRIAFDWQVGSPHVDLPADGFTVRWLGEFQAPLSGDLTLIARSDDGIRVWIDDRLVVNDWYARAPAESRFTLPVDAGHWHRIRIDYFEAKGGATINLSWEGNGLARQIVPTAALRPLTQPAMAELPTASPVSPVCITGLRRPDAAVTAAVNGRAQRVLDLPDTGFYFNARLDPDRPVTVTAGASTGDIAWTPTVLAGEQDLFLRAGDAILLTTPTTVLYSIAHESGVKQSERQLKAGARRIETFKKPGSYRIHAEDGNGLIVADIAIVVVAVDFDGPIANQVGHRREKGVEVIGGNSDAVIFSTSDESLLGVSFKEQTAYGARLYLTSRRHGTPTVVARLAGSGAIIGTQPIDEFSLSTKAISYAVRNVENGSATVQLVMRPWIPDLTAQFRMFAHRATFEGGGKALDVDTGEFSAFKDPVTGEQCAQLDVNLSIPDGENMYCFRLTMDQHSRHGTPVGSTSVNGSACDFEVQALYIETGDTKTHSLVVIEGAENPDAAHHGKRPTFLHKITVDADTAKQVKITANSTFNCIPHNNWRPKVRAEKKAKDGRYPVAIDGTIFEEKIIISTLCEFELSATAETADKKKLYRVYPGQTVTITATLKKKQKQGGVHSHHLRIIGPTTIPPFDVTCPTEVGQSVSVTLDILDRRLAAGDYDARILGAEQKKIFTITDRVTLNNHIDTLSGELGFVDTGGASVDQTGVNVTQAPLDGGWTTTLVSTCTVTYFPASGLTNHLAPGQPKEWPPAEREKAPTDEIANWTKCVDKIQKHEEGHVTVWNGQMTPRTVTFTGTGTGPDKTASQLAAQADLLQKREVGTQTILDAIKAADVAAQEAFHGTPTGSSDLNPFKITGRD